MYADRPRRLESLIDFADRRGDRLHIVQSERLVTFAEMRSAVAERATDLVARGLRPQDRVVLLSWNSPETVANFWATVSIGTVAALANA
jgi:steroid-24-oyl-CoA synthetase